MDPYRMAQNRFEQALADFEEAQRLLKPSHSQARSRHHPQARDARGPLDDLGQLWESFGAALSELLQALLALRRLQFNSRTYLGELHFLHRVNS